MSPRKGTKGGRKPNICRCMLGADLSWRCVGRHRLRCQPCSRIGENPPYGMIGGIEETSASSKPDPRLDPTRPWVVGLGALATFVRWCKKQQAMQAITVPTIPTWPTPSGNVVPFIRVKVERKRG